ncbi:MAG: MotA/TolQ/ExbB proton channel family protein [Acidobacteria bacterium]|nr:MotA/TolQ/ExbB proton channel family protein [Acidobacteriota bacterium]
MRRFLIRELLPMLLCTLPAAGGVLVVAAVPRRALDFYLESIRTSYLDWIILGLGGGFFLVQLLLALRALRWLEQAFDQRPDPWIQRFYQAAEWFPLLGLFGTVAGILQTFGAVGEQGSLQQQEIIHLYAPALTTTGSGLLMALLNIVPLWIVAVGRGLILSLSADPALSREP